VGPWIFTASCYAERPEFVELVVQRGLTHPYPQPLHGYLRQADAVLSHDTRGRLPGVRVPTLVTVGSEDILTPPRFSRELAALVPDARLETIPGAGHGYFWEAPARFNAACLDFLARVDGAR
jgi:3-oxoadipate enol-lactonase